MIPLTIIADNTYGIVNVIEVYSDISVYTRKMLFVENETVAFVYDRITKPTVYANIGLTDELDQGVLLTNGMNVYLDFMDAGGQQ